MVGLCPEMSDFSSVSAPLATPSKGWLAAGVWGKENGPIAAPNRCSGGDAFVPQALPIGEQEPRL